jgi:hypothetical protein
MNYGNNSMTTKAGLFAALACVGHIAAPEAGTPTAATPVTQATATNNAEAARALAASEAGRKAFADACTTEEHAADAYGKLSEKIGYGAYVKQNWMSFAGFSLFSGIIAAIATWYFYGA